MKNSIVRRLAVVIAASASMLIGCAFNSHAQPGRVSFYNGPLYRVLDYTMPGPDYGQPIFGAAGTYEYGLYIGPLGSVANQLTLVGTALNPASDSSTHGFAGEFNGGNPFPLPNLPDLTLDGNTPITFQIRGWLASYGDSFEEAVMNGDLFVAMSDLGYVTPTVSPNLPANLFGTAPGQIGQFGFVVVPEPSTVALGGLGVASLLLFRRRK